MAHTSDKWVVRVLATAGKTARAQWGQGWSLLTPDMRRAYIALEVVAAISALDEEHDSAERALRIRRLCEIAMTGAIA